MTSILGEYSLCAAMLMAAGGLMMALVAYRSESMRALVTARRMIVLQAVAVTVACAALFKALLDSDFHNAYVASYTERALPWGYKLAAFWAGQEGSLLLWAWLLAGLAALVVILHRKREGRDEAAMTAVLAGVTGFFSMLMLFAASPFKWQAVAPVDGHGLNPLLQDPGMIAHPPLLFVGYAGFAIPFAMMIGALAVGKPDHDWIVQTRRWLLFAWLFLTAGIVLGAQWAYVELGWGGYWAWDPVENASLLPWLTGTALLHSIMAQQQRGLFRIWNAALAAATFILCIFGTYLTRSGIIDSVHAFGESVIGTFFLGFLAVLVMLSVALIAVRVKPLRSSKAIEGLATREGAFLATNVLLCIITGIVLMGTVFPLVSELITGNAVTVKPEFYNRVVMPLSIVLVAVMAVGPLLIYGKDAMARVQKMGAMPALFAAGALVVAIAQGLASVWALACVAIAAFGIAAVAVDLRASAKQRAAGHQESVLTAMLKLIDSNHRRYGGQLAHIGMLMIMVGVLGSGLFGEKQNVTMARGDRVTVAGHTLVFDGLREERDVNFTAIRGDVTLEGPRGGATTLVPEIRYFDKSEQPHTEVALQSTLVRDVYVTIAGWEDGGARVALQVIISPLVVWIWIGGIVMCGGGVLGLLPRFVRHHAAATEQSEESAPMPAGERKSRPIAAASPAVSH